MSRVEPRASYDAGLVYPQDSVEIEEEIRRLFSIRTVFIVLCFGTAAGLFTVTVVGSTLCDGALEKTEDANNAAFNACYVATEEDLNANVRDQAMLEGSYLTGRVTDYLNLLDSLVAKTMLELRIIESREGPLMSGWDLILHMEHELVVSVATMHSFGLRSFAFSIGILGINVGKTIDSNEVRKDWMNGTNPPSYAYTVMINTTTGADEGETTLFFLHELGNPLYPAYTTGIQTSREPQWSPLLEIGSSVSAIQFVQWIDARTDTLSGLYVTLSMNKLSEVLQSSLEEVGGMAYIVVADSWMANAYAGLPDPQPFLTMISNDTGVLVATSHGNASRVVDGSSRKIKDVEATDPGIMSVAKFIHSIGGYQHIVDTDLVQAPINNRTMIICVVKYEPYESISWFITMALEYSVVMANAEAIGNQARANRDEEEKKAKDDITKNLLLSRIIAGCITMIFLGCSLLTSRSIAKPIKQLQVDMKHVSAMDLSEAKEHDELSYVKEIAEIQTGFAKMIVNLEEFRAYVPSALLGTNFVKATPPQGDIALVFTDIVSSTSLWAKAPIEMDTALELHNTVMREACAAFDGYEVKTIGDAFMVAFTSSVPALKFCCKVQTDLAQQVWPEAIELPPISTAKDILLWNGIRVRMGCHHGEAVLEENPLTGRSDYRGTVVNTASRVESKAMPGTICITDTTKTAIEGHSEPWVVKDHGKHDLKGLGDVHLSLLITTTLSERLEWSDATVKIHRGDSYTSGGTQGTVDSLEKNKKRKSHTNTVKKTKLNVVKGDVTVATVGLMKDKQNMLFEYCNIMVRVVSDSANQTEGMVGGMCGSWMWVAWNTTKPNKVHSACGLRFVAELKRRTDGIFKVGLCTGPALHGNVGTQANRFQNIFGSTLRLSIAAADYTAMFSTFALIADNANNSFTTQPSITSYIRIVDSWLHSRDELDSLINVYEVMTSKLLDSLEWSSGFRY